MALYITASGTCRHVTPEHGTKFTSFEIIQYVGGLASFGPVPPPSIYTRMWLAHRVGDAPNVLASNIAGVPAWLAITGDVLLTTEEEW
jgi:hypothetical protein